jgi:lipoprotein-releasing system permease protein
MNNKFQWIYFISRRISKVDRKGRTAVSSMLASLGVCFGVFALIVVMSVMNGFQMSFFDSIMEISSYDLRVSNLSLENSFDLNSFCEESKDVSCIVPFYEVQGLMAGSSGNQSASLIRAIDKNVASYDDKFIKELNVFAGEFDLSEKDSIVVGNTLAKNLGLRIGSKVNIVAMSGSNEVSLLSQNRVFTVKGIFFSGYADINASYSFINLDYALEKLCDLEDLTYGIKLEKQNKDSIFSGILKSKFDGIKVESWRSFNRSFFGALKLEKNLLSTLLFLIFIVVAVNIYNGIKKLVYERREEIAILSSFGASEKDIKNVFLIQGALTGLLGAIPGLLLALFTCINIEYVFIALSKIQYALQFVFYKIINADSYFIETLTENPMFAVYASIPARMNFIEIFWIFIFGLSSSIFASYLASRNILKFSISEVLRNE